MEAGSLDAVGAKCWHSPQPRWNGTYVPATRRIGLITTRAGGKSVQASRLRHTVEKPGRRWPSTATMKDVAGHLGKLEARRVISSSALRFLGASWLYSVRILS